MSIAKRREPSVAPARSPGRSLAMAAIAAVGVGVSACESDAEQARQAEAAALVQAINQLRDAPNAGKRPLYKALQKLPCSSEDLCELKRVCSKAYARHLRALDATRVLRHAMADDAGVASSGSAEAAKLAGDAQRYLERARFLGRRCVRMQGQIEQHYGL